MQCYVFFILHLHTSFKCLYIYFYCLLYHSLIEPCIMINHTFAMKASWGLWLIRDHKSSLYYIIQQVLQIRVLHSCSRASMVFFIENENEKLFVGLKRVPGTFIFKTEGSRVWCSDEGSARHFYATSTSYSPLGLSWLCIITKQLGGTLTVIYTVLTITISGSPHRCDCLEAGDQSFLSFPLIWLSISVSNSS